MFLGFGYCEIFLKFLVILEWVFFAGGRGCLGFLFDAILAGHVQNGSLAQRKASARSLGRDRRGCPGSGAPVASPGDSSLPPPLGCPRGPRDSPSSARQKITHGGGRPDGTGRDGGAGVALAMVLHRPRPCGPSATPTGRTAPLSAPSSGDPGPRQGGRPRWLHRGRARSPGRP